MSEGREVALLAALKAVMATAAERGFDIDELTEAAAERLIAAAGRYPRRSSAAIYEIELAADAVA